MDIPRLLGPDGQPISPERTFLVDGHGNQLNPSSKDFALPSYLTVSSIISGAQRTYLSSSYDEALKHSRQNALAMWRDCRISGWLNERVESVVQLPWHLEVEDEKDPAQKCVKDGLTRAIKRIPHFKQILRNICKGGLWSGRGVTELAWRWETMDLPTIQPRNFFEGIASAIITGKLHQDPDSKTDMNGKPLDSTPQLAARPVLMPFINRPVNGDKINYLWGQSPGGAPPGTPLIRVYGAISNEIKTKAQFVPWGPTQEEYEINAAEVIYDDQGPTIALVGPWRERFIIWTFDPDDADYYLPEMAGGIYGVGIRSRIYWLNWIRMEYAAWIQDLFDRVGLGFIVIKYDMGSDKAKREAIAAAQKWNRRAVLAVPVSPDQLQKAGSIEVVEVPTTGAVVVQELVKYCDKHIERFILRQLITTGSSSKGEGARGQVGPTEMAQNTEHQRIKSDAEQISEVMTGSNDEPGVVSVMKRYTYPGANFPVRFVLDVPELGAHEKLQSAVMLAGLEVELDADEVRETGGFSKPTPGAVVVGGKKKPVEPPEGSPTPRVDGGDKGKVTDKKQGNGDESASKKAAKEFIAEGKPGGGRIKEIATDNGVTRQAVGEATKRLEGATQSNDTTQFEGDEALALYEAYRASLEEALP